MANPTPKKNWELGRIGGVCDGCGRGASVHMHYARTKRFAQSSAALLSFNPSSCQIPE